MMKHEFEALYGEEVTVERFRMINELYMYYDELFPEKKDIVFVPTHIPQSAHHLFLLCLTSLFHNLLYTRNVKEKCAHL